MDETTSDKAPESGADLAETDKSTAAGLPPAASAVNDADPPAPPLPDYKGAPLDPDRGPGLGCFWFQVILLVAFLVLTPISVWVAAPSWLSAALLILSLVLLFFVGQTMIFLLRLVAADRRTRRRPLAPTARQTVGQMEDAATTAAPKPPSDQDDAATDEPLT